MAETRDPFAYDIYYLSYFTTLLEQALETNFPWSLTKNYLKILSNFGNIRTMDFVGNDAKFLIDTIDARNDDNKPLSNIDKQFLKGNIGEWRGKITQIFERWVLCVPELTLDIRKLTGGIESFLESEELGVLEPIERHGLSESAACLLHNSFTSAEFIVLRAAESILRRWYEKKTGQKIKRERWGDILNELNKLYPSVAERPKELSLLDYLRQRRNEIDHPDVISTPYEATATFLNVIAVCKVVKDELLR